jgi:prepilin-type N-terminal cleavage/methylation domain-containing protein
MNRTAPRVPRHHHRSGFSLLELLAAIVIIAILISLLFPAIGALRRRAQITLISSELTRIDTAIATFSSSGAIGVQPWSKIILTEDPSITAWDPVSQSKLRRMFEGMNFDSTIQRDFNGDNTFDGDATPANSSITLDSSECLVFFLGGVQSLKTPGATQALTGFSKNPVEPFTRDGSNRLGPYFTFDAGRLVDTDGDGMFEYLDNSPNQKLPYHFASSNNGQGYDSATQIYVQADGKTPWNKDGHQLISPGADGDFGFVTTPPPLRNTFAVGTVVTGAASDNIANFKPGTTLGE